LNAAANREVGFVRQMPASEGRRTFAAIPERQETETRGFSRSIHSRRRAGHVRYRQETADDLGKSRGQRVPLAGRRTRSARRCSCPAILLLQGEIRTHTPGDILRVFTRIVLTGGTGRVRFSTIPSRLAQAASIMCRKPERTREAPSTSKHQGLPCARRPPALVVNQRRY
jgi:hypothetical protein